MTIYDMAPVVLGTAILVVGFLSCRVGHDRAIAARDARRAAEQAVAAE